MRNFGESRISLQPELRKRENEWVLSLFESEAPLVHPEVFAKLVRGDTSNIQDSPERGLPTSLVENLQNAVKKLFPEVDTLLSENESDLRLNGIPLYFGELSEGYRSLFALLGHLLRCSLKVRNWQIILSKLDGITLIDEVDIHLHPTWQLHVGKIFKRRFLIFS